ncbi:nuclease-related domain-containing protein [Myxococcota bacterium]
MEHIGVIVAIAWVAFLYACYRLILARRRSRLRRMGERGERKVRRSLFAWFPLSRRFHDVYVEHDGYMTQIDHVVINDRGVFVLETKNWSGTAIYGDRDADAWVVSYANGSEAELGNPIRQNEWHADMVARVLRLERHHVHNIVVMTGRAWFANGEPDEVLSLWEVRRMAWAMPRVFSPERVKQLGKRLEKARLPSKKWVRKAHLASIRSRRVA